MIPISDQLILLQHYPDVLRQLTGKVFVTENGIVILDNSVLYELENVFEDYIRVYTPPSIPPNDKLNIQPRNKIFNLI